MIYEKNVVALLALRTHNLCMVTFSCPHCDQHINAPESMSGMQTNCPTCKKPIKVPGEIQCAPKRATKKSGSGIISIVIVSSLVVFLGRTCGSYLGKSAALSEIEQKNNAIKNSQIGKNEVEIFASNLDSITPYNVDSITILKSVTIGDKKSVIMSYHIKGGHSVLGKEKDLKKMIDTSYDSSEMKLLRDNNYKLIWLYRDDNNDLISVEAP